jgi:hypothetical protein
VADPAYPFLPKSNRQLRPGQFWPVPLSDGRFACGRVIAAASPIGSRVGFIAGLMDWVGDAPPTASTLGDPKGRGSGTRPRRDDRAYGGELFGCRAPEKDGLVAERDRGSTPGDTFIAPWQSARFEGPDRLL